MERIMEAIKTTVQIMWAYYPSLCIFALIVFITAAGIIIYAQFKENVD